MLEIQGYSSGLGRPHVLQRTVQSPQTNVGRTQSSLEESSEHYSQHILLMDCLLIQSNTDVILPEELKFLSFLHSVLLGICLREDGRCLLVLHNS